MKRFRKLFVVLTVVALLFSLTTFASADTSDNEVQQLITKWRQNGLFDDAMPYYFNPNGSIKSTEFLNLVKNVFDYVNEEDTNTDWEDAVNNAEATNVLRYKAAELIFKVLELEIPENETSNITFKDILRLPETNKSYIYSVVQKGYMNGYDDSTFKPYQPVTYVEAFKMLDKVLEALVNNSKVLKLENIVPFTFDDKYELDEDHPIKIDVAANDILNVETSYTIEIDDTNVRGRLYVYDKNTIYYIPLRNFYGEETFSYKLVSEDGSSDYATVTMVVNPVNDAPVAIKDKYINVKAFFYIGAQDLSQYDHILYVRPMFRLPIPGRFIVIDGNRYAIELDLLANDHDVDDNDLRITEVYDKRRRRSTVEIVNDGKSIRYTPAGNGKTSWGERFQELPKNDTFYYTVSDSEGKTATAKVRVKYEGLEFINLLDPNELP